MNTREAMKQTRRYNVTIRPMVDADAEAVAELCGELGYPSKTEAVRRRLRAIKRGDVLIAAVNESGTPVGYIQATTTCTIEADVRVHIVGLVVSSKARRMGIGRRLIAEVETWARRTEAEGIVVRSNIARGEAHDFYPALGYAKVKTQAVYLKKLTD